MSKHQGAYDTSQGNPNLEVLQYLQDNWDADAISSAKRVVKTSVISGVAGITVDIATGATIIDAHVICTASNGSGSMTVKNGANAITNAMACTTQDALARAATIDSTYQIVGTSAITVVANGNADAGDVYITYTK